MPRNKLTLIAIVAGLVPVIAHGQQLTGVAGAMSKHANIALSWSIGESATGVAHNASQSVIVGFQQPESLTITSVFIDPENAFHIFPNPAREKIFIERPANMTNVRVSLYDLNGKILHQNDFEPDNSRLEIMIENLTAGVYILRGHHEKRLLFESKLIKI